MSRKLRQRAVSSVITAADYGEWSADDDEAAPPVKKKQNQKDSDDSVDEDDSNDEKSQNGKGDRYPCSRNPPCSMSFKLDGKARRDHTCKHTNKRRRESRGEKAKPPMSKHSSKAKPMADVDIESSRFTELTKDFVLTTIDGSFNLLTTKHAILQLTCDAKQAESKKRIVGDHNSTAVSNMIATASLFDGEYKLPCRFAANLSPILLPSLRKFAVLSISRFEVDIFQEDPMVDDQSWAMNPLGCVIYIQQFEVLHAGADVRGWLGTEPRPFDFKKKQQALLPALANATPVDQRVMYSWGNVEDDAIEPVPIVVCNGDKCGAKTTGFHVQRCMVIIT
jgi:hypothetical protein